MNKPRDRTVSQRSDGSWENKRRDATKASSIHETQREAEQAAKRMLQNQGGGELTVKSTKGVIRSKDTIPPGNDPVRRKDLEH